MKVGDLVRPVKKGFSTLPPLVEEDWKGIVVDWRHGNPVVYWSDKFPSEVEYSEQLEVINESR